MIWYKRYFFFICHVLFSWRDRTWQFATGLFFIELTPGSLRLAGVYDAAMSITVILFGPTIGRWVDNNSRISVVKKALLLQCSSVIVCSSLFCLHIAYNENFRKGLNDYGSTLTQLAIILISCLTEIGNCGFKLALEKDWIVVLSQVHNIALSKMNSILRILDLITLILTPTLTGFIMSSYGMITGGCFVIGWFFISFFVEMKALQYLVSITDDLRRPKESKRYELSSTTKLVKKINMHKEMWKRFFVHDVRNAGLSIATTYMTFLSMNNYTIGYMSSAGINKGLLGVFTGVSATIGAIGAVTYPILRSKIGKVKTGLVGYGAEIFCLSFCVAAMFAPGSLFDPLYFWKEEYSINATGIHKSQSLNFTLSEERNLSYNSPNNSTDFTDENSSTSQIAAALLLFGVITSRFGLWTADLSVTQILQEDVEEKERGSINGVHFAIIKIVSLLRALFMIILPSVETFGYLVILTVSVISCGLLLFLSYGQNYSKKLDVEVKFSKESHCDHDTNMYYCSKQSF